MLHQCCHGGYCSCEVLHGTVPFSILFPLRNNKASMQRGGREEEEEEFYSSSFNISSSSSNYNNNNNNVDCTLSLGTPSTRQTTHNYSNSTTNIKPSFCSWDFFSHSSTTTTTTTTNNNNGNSNTTTTSTTCLAGDPLLLARRCANCDTTSTPLWRNGPRGPKSLCNACGIRYKKEERRAAASSKGPSISMSFSGDVEEKNNYLSWRLNVVPRDINRTSLFQYQ
ncbi:Zinc finger NHR/GATA-type protein [Dioscorea alata]|uniref:Zinc finger NHR/GATA-type protein n=1 Tax=Dioscorea alata TaxID=55571 RepID=A0ACB7WDV5_DIOAL|nr:Zinc finger NHR/GATA-type protein [Dioscorea alata]